MANWNTEPTILRVAMREAIGSLRSKKARDVCLEVTEGGKSLKETSEKWGWPEWKILRTLRRALAGVAKEAGVRRRNGRRQGQVNRRSKVGS